MDMRQLLEVIGSRWRLLVACVVALVLVSVVVHGALSPKYIATASVLIDNRGLNPVVGASTQDPAQQRPLIATQSNIIGSARVTRKVVADLKLQDDPAWSEAWKSQADGAGDLSMWIGSRLLRDLEVRPGAADSNVIDIRFSARDPHTAARFANAFSQAYLATAMELRVEPSQQTATFFNNHTRALREQLSSAQQRLSSYQQKHGIISGDERVDVETALLNEMATQLTTSRAQRIDSQSRNQQARGDATISQDVLGSPVVQGLQAEVAKSEAKVQQLATTLGRNHPMLETAREELSQMRKSLASETRRIAASVGSGERVSSSREQDILQAMERQKQRVMQLRGERNQYDLLKQEVDGAQKAVDMAMQRLTQTTLESESKYTDATLLAAALPPATSSRLPLGLTAPVAALVGLMLGALFALMLEQRDPRIRGTRDVAELLGIPVLARIGTAQFKLPRAPRPPLIGRLGSIRALTGPAQAKVAR